MSRFLTPVLFAGAALYVANFNAQHDDRALMLPFMDVLSPAAAGDMHAQGALTVQVLSGLAAVFGLFAVVGFVRDRSRGDEPAD